ncbi:MAG: transposase [Verrucomicrobia bacterium]|nr:transposase [Verrucomicrobiota bacterium]
MKNKRRIHRAEFKARIALEAIKGLKTVQQIAAENEVHPTQVTPWKIQMRAGASEVFDQRRCRKTEQERDK